MVNSSRDKHEGAYLRVCGGRGEPDVAVTPEREGWRKTAQIKNEMSKSKKKGVEYYCGVIYRHVCIVHKQLVVHECRMRGEIMRPLIWYPGSEL